MSEISYDQIREIFETRLLPERYSAAEIQTVVKDNRAMVVHKPTRITLIHAGDDVTGSTEYLAYKPQGRLIFAFDGSGSVIDKRRVGGNDRDSRWIRRYRELAGAQFGL